MEIEFERKGMGFLRPLVNEVQTQEQTQELRLSDEMPDIGRILGAWGQVILRGKEWRGDRIACNGGVMVWLLYEPEDGSGPRPMETWIPFQMKWDVDDGRHDGDIRIRCLLRSVDARSVSPRKIMVRCSVAALGQAYRKDTAMLAVPGQLPEGVQVLKKRYPVRTLQEAGEKTFTLDEDLTFPAASAEPEKLLAYTLEPRLQEVKVMTDKLVLRGQANLHVVFRDSQGATASAELEVPVSQFAQLENTFSAEAQGDVLTELTGLELDLDESKHLRLKAGLVAQYTVSDRQLLELVEDAYSPEQEVEPVMEEMELPRILDTRQLSIPVRQTLRQSASELADVTYLPDFPVIQRGMDIRMELPGQFQVVFRDENGALQSSTARTLEHYDLPAGESCRMEANIFPLTSASGSAGEGIELKSEVLLALTCSAAEGISLVTGLKLGQTRSPDPSRPSLILRRAGSADLWQIAKSTGSTVDAITRANGLEGEPAPERILLIPVH